MLNKSNERELAYLVKVDSIAPIAGRDRVESAVIGGWTCMVQKGVFKPGDIGIYFEIDSKCPAVEPFLFLEKRHYAIKTQKFRTPDGRYFSQGLLMHPSDFGWKIEGNVVIDNKEKLHRVEDESRFLTEQLGVTYYVPEDNQRKAKEANKYDKMQQRHKKLFRNPIVRRIMRFKIGRKIMFFFFGKKKDVTHAWPSFVKKTDEERVQSCAYLLNNKEPMVVCEKLDGSSSTFAIKRKKRDKYDFWVCSRNVAFVKNKKENCFYPENIYLKMAAKYNMESVLHKMLEVFPEEEWIYIQGETYGDGVQKRNYSLKNEVDFAAFNLVFSTRGRQSSITGKDLLAHFGIPWVPIVNDHYILPDDVQTILEYAGSEKSKIDGGMREGIVVRSMDGQISFKAVDNEYLVRYHG